MAVQTVPLSDFLPMVLPNAPGVPIPVAEFNLRLAAIEFCERTRCWRHVMTKALTGQTITVIAPAYAAIHEFEHAAWNEEPLQPVQFSDIALEGTEPADQGPPRYISQAKPDSVILFPPVTTGTLALSVFLKPRGGNEFGGNPDDPLEDAFDRVPEFMHAQHGEAIAYGALARILAIPKQQYTNPQMAGFYMQRFNAAMDAKFSANMRGQQRAPRRTHYHDF